MIRKNPLVVHWSGVSAARSALLVLIALPTFSALSASAAAADFPRLSGIFGPGGRGLDPPPTESLNLPFVDGLVMYPAWATLEPIEGQYDFSPVDLLISLVQPAGKQIGLAVVASDIPEYILDTSGVQTYLRRGVGQTTCLTESVVPWDPLLQARWASFCEALANHQVPDVSQEGAPLRPLREHPAVRHVLCEVPGAGGIRDIGGCLVNASGYTRTVYIDAVLSGITAMQDRFADKFTYIFFFNINDGQSPDLTGEILNAFHTTFDGVSRPRLGLMEENLSCDGPPSGNNPLFLEQDATFTMFQMLQSWVVPHRNPDQTDECLVTTVPGDRSTAISGPEVGMQYAYSTYQCHYFEPYQADLIHEGFADEFLAWHALIHADDTTDAGAATAATEFGLRLVGKNPIARASGEVAQIALDAPIAASVRLDVIDVAGRVVAELHNGPVGSGTHIWAASDLTRAGVYWVRLVAPGLNTSRKLVVAR